MNLAISILVCTFSLSAFAARNESPEIVEAAPLDPFSERSSFWPNQAVPPDSIHIENRAVFDSLNEIPGVQSSRNGSPFVSVRGSLGTDRVLGLYDGLSLNLRDGFGMNTLLIPRETLGGVNLLKGPSSLFYGADAFGGAIDFRTRYFKRPTVRVQGEFKQPYREQTQQSLLGVVPLLEPSSNQALQISAFIDEQGGEYPYTLAHSGQSGLRSRNDVHTQRYTLSGYQRPRSNWEVSEKLIFAREIGSIPGAASSPYPNSFKNQAFLAALTNSVRLHPLWKVSHRANFMNVEKDYFDEPALTRTLSHTQKAGNSVSVIEEIGSSQIEYMVDHQYHQDESSRTVGGFKTQQDLDAGAILRISMWDDWILVPGVRAVTSVGDYVKSLALIQEQLQRKTWLSYSEGIKLASFTQLYGDTSFYRSNPSLRPEHSEQTEIGFLKRAEPLATNFRDSIYYGFSAFFTRYKDLQVSQNMGSFYQYQNQSQATSSGFDLSAGARIWNFILGGQYAYLQTRDQTGERSLPRSPENQLAVTVDFPFGPFVFGAKDTYWGKYYLNNGSSLVEMMPWHSVDFTIRTLALSNWSVQAGVLNAFDASRELTYDFPEEQRRFFFSLEHAL